MKDICFRIFILLLILTPLRGYSQLAFSTTESSSTPFDLDQQTDVLLDTSHVIVKSDFKNASTVKPINFVPIQDLYLVYNTFKDKKMDKVFSIMSKYGFKKKVFKTIKIVPKGTVDSLVLVRNDDSKITLTMVDLGYLRCVTARMLMSVDDAAMQIERFEQVLLKDGYRLRLEHCVPSIFCQFQVDDEYWVIDSRWPERTYTKFTSLYDLVLSKYDEDKFVAIFRETIPMQWVTRDQVPSDKLR